MMLRMIFYVIAVGALPLVAWADGDLAPCDVKVNFGSMCCGIDGTTEAKVLKLLGRSKLVEQGQTRRDTWGREGERSYCVYVKDGVTARQKKKLVKDIHKLIPKCTTGNQGRTWVDVTE